ncbi:hypothetical protein PDESU_06008 [Pontiella desulfatans]|uniref:Uncharacterized protein n=1 Tax=Pontiella desulfatans TaxID=2750659 RepID=A0A6C2UB67_PONDE|nr:DUF4928 family protein [Pontiella desulfatans]VGO17412.1 hypothetical protein PDESU_06008 [Pontiella desulfatans]
MKTPKGIVLKYDDSSALSSLFKNLLEKAKDMGQDSCGTWYHAKMMHYLTLAIMEMALKEPLQGGKTVGSSPEYQTWQYFYDRLTIYITQTPTEALIRKCAENLSSNKSPVVVTSYKGAVSADNLAEAQNISDRIDIFEIEQFIATNIWEICRFTCANRKITVSQLVEKYNAIVDAHETDPSLGLVMG